GAGPPCSRAVRVGAGWLGAALREPEFPGVVRPEDGNGANAGDGQGRHRGREDFAGRQVRQLRSQSQSFCSGGQQRQGTRSHHWRHGADSQGRTGWVYPEELEITTAYWWAPDSSRVAFLEMDEREVNRYPLVDFASPTGEADEERYPVAGGKNPVVHVYTVPVAGGAARLMDTGPETNVYLARVNWLRDSRHVAIQRLNRAQTQLDLLVADAVTGNSR